MAEKKAFRFTDETATIVFDDGPYEGAEVKARLNVPLGMFIKLQEYQETGEYAEALLLFGDNVLISWNLEDAEGRLPIGRKGMKRVPPRFARVLLEKWGEAAQQVPVPLEQQSNGTGPSGEHSTETETASSSPDRSGQPVS